MEDFVEKTRELLIKKNDKNLKRFDIYNYSVKKKFKFSQDFYKELTKFNPEDEEFYGDPILKSTENIFEEGKNDSYFYIPKETHLIADRLNKLIDCYFFEIKSSLDAFAHKINVVFQLCPENIKINFKHLYDNEFHYKNSFEGGINITNKLKSDASNVLSSIKGIMEEIGLLDEFRNKITHASIVLEIIKVKSFLGEKYEKEEIDYPFKVTLDSGEKEIPTCIIQINEKIKNFYLTVDNIIYEDFKKILIKKT